VTARGILSLAGLALLAGLSYGLLRWVETSLRGPAPPESQTPVLTLKRLHAVRMTAAGRREFTIEAHRLWQLAGPGGVRLERPELDWYQPDGQTREWRLRGEWGWVSADRQTLLLEGEVVVDRTAESGRSPVTLLTRDVRVRPTEHYLETAAPTRAVTPGGELRAVGARAWLDQERVELLSEVRGVYEPPQP
jgi:lipopolysaccharide export system protein LptC